VDCRVSVVIVRNNCRRVWRGVKGMEGARPRTERERSVLMDATAMY
jgi:hypothetical protein